MNHFQLVFIAVLAALLSCSGTEKQEKIRYNKIKITGEIPFDMPEITEPVFPDAVFNVLDFGAVNDGKTKNTEAFASAIKACNRAGGGMVLVPSGKWFTGPVGKGSHC